jgi:hypothetical protein
VYQEENMNTVAIQADDISMDFLEMLKKVYHGMKIVVLPEADYQHILASGVDERPEQLRWEDDSKRAWELF